MAESIMQRCWKGAARKFGCVASAGLIAASLAIPGTALAAAGTGSNGGWFDLPTEVNTGLAHADGTRYVSTALLNVFGGFAQTGYQIMGVNGSNFDRLPSAINASRLSGSTYTITAGDAAAGIMGTSVNQAPDEYLANSLAVFAAGGNYKNPLDAQQDVITWINSAARNRTQHDTISVQVNGEEYDMPQPIYYEVNLINSGEAMSAGETTIEEWIAIENQREGRRYSGTYAPTLMNVNMGSGANSTLIGQMHELGKQLDQIEADTNGAVVSRYVDADDDAKYDSARDIARAYEDFANGTQYYLNSLFVDGLEQKVVAVVCGYQPANDTYSEAAYAVRVIDVDAAGQGISSPNFGGRLANSLANIAIDVNTVMDLEGVEVAFEPITSQYKEEQAVRWYYVSDIVKYADVVFTCDTPSQNNVNQYLATNADGKPLSLWSPTQPSGYEDENKDIEPLIDAAASVSGAKAKVYYSYPSHLFGAWYAQGFENPFLAAMCATYMYPDQFTTIENVMAYMAKNFWHINASDVNSVVAATCYDISLPNGRALTKPSANYQNIIDKMIYSGNEYYLDGAYETLDTYYKGDIKTYDMADLQARFAASDADETLEPGPATFADVTNQYYAQAATAMSELGLIVGSNGNFAGDTAMTRGQLATMLWRYANPAEANAYDMGSAVNTSRFTDVRNGQYYTAAVAWASETGVMNGDAGKTTFRPNDKIKFQEFVVAVHNFSGQANGSESALSKFSDNKSVASWAKGAMAWAVSNEVVHGNDNGTLTPLQNVTRGRAAAVLYNAIQAGQI